MLSSFRPTSVMCLLHASLHRRFGRPLLLFPGMSTSNILLTMCSSFILLTWPYHACRFSVIFLDACTTLVVPLMCSFRILSLLVTPHILSASSSYLLLVVLQYIVYSVHFLNCQYLSHGVHVEAFNYVDMERLVLDLQTKNWMLT